MPYLSPLIHRHIRETIRFRILLSIDMCKHYLSSPYSYRFEDRRGDFFEFYIFDLIVSWELFDDEEAVRSQFDLGRSEFYRSSDTEKCSCVLCDIIGRMTDILILLFDDRAILRR